MVKKQLNTLTSSPNVLPTSSVLSTAFDSLPQMPLKSVSDAHCLALGSWKKGRGKIFLNFLPYTKPLRPTLVSKVNPYSDTSPFNPTLLLSHHCFKITFT